MVRFHLRLSLAFNSRSFPAGRLTHELGSGSLHVKLPSGPVFEGYLSIRGVVQLQLLPERFGGTKSQHTLSYAIRRLTRHELFAVE